MATHVTSPRQVLRDSSVASPRQRLAEARLARLLPRRAEMPGLGSPIRSSSHGHSIIDGATGLAEPAGSPATRSAVAASYALDSLVATHVLGGGSPRQLEKQRQPVHVALHPDYQATIAAVTLDPAVARAHISAGGQHAERAAAASKTVGNLLGTHLCVQYNMTAVFVDRF